MDNRTPQPSALGLENEAEFDASLQPDPRDSKAAAPGRAPVTSAPASTGTTPNPALETPGSTIDAQALSDLEQVMSAEPGRPTAPAPLAATPAPGAGPAAGRPPRTQEAAPPPWAGKLLGHFKLLRPIGRGRMGLVIQARDVNLDRIVAIKVMRKQVTGLEAAQTVNQFLREARAAARLDHPNVARVFEIGEHGGWWYIAAEMIEGSNLQEVVRAAGPLSPARAAAIIADAATALAAGHQAGVVHRDVKPSNLMITRTGRCKVTDFGLVRLEDPNDPFDFTDKCVGTPQYMAPEIIDRHPPTPLVDVYSLGCTLYFALTGTAPFLARTVGDLLNLHRHAPPPDPRAKNPATPESLVRLMQRAMAKNPLERPNAAELAAALRIECIGAMVDESGVVADPPSGSGVFEILKTSSPDTWRQRLAGPRPADEAAQAALRQRLSWLWALLAGEGIGMCLLLLALILWGSGRPTPPPTQAPEPRAAAVAAQLAQRFAQAPATWGDRAPGSLPIAPPPTEWPAFSWLHNPPDPRPNFVGHTRGSHYFRSSDPRAALIPAEHLETFETEAAAQADSRTAAPMP